MSSLRSNEGDFTMARTALWLTKDEMEVAALALARAADAGLMGKRADTAYRVEGLALIALKGRPERVSRSL
jgi:hypothetical protein